MHVLLYSSYYIVKFFKGRDIWLIHLKFFLPSQPLQLSNPLFNNMLFINKELGRYVVYPTFVSLCLICWDK